MIIRGVIWHVRESITQHQTTLEWIGKRGCLFNRGNPRESQYNSIMDEGITYNKNNSSFDFFLALYLCLHQASMLFNEHGVYPFKFVQYI